MSLLEQTQKSFYQAILDKDSAVDFIESNDASARLDIYRATIFENLHNSLALTFPGVCALLGDKCFKSAAYLFIKDPDQMPTTGCLDDWGEDFPQFLAQQSQLQHLPYLKDYAVYEWLLHLAYHADKTAVIDPIELNKIPEDHLEHIHVKFIPSMFLYNAEFSIDRIEAQIKQADASTLILKHNNTGVVIAKTGKQVKSLFIPQDELEFFKYLNEGERLGKAISKTTEKYSDFNVTMAIKFLLQHSLIQSVF
jgi:hypothetical protein